MVVKYVMLFDFLSFLQDSDGHGSSQVPGCLLRVEAVLHLQLLQ
jgi:hypothetical protein